MTSFVHLSVHSEYSMVDSLIQVDALMTRTVENKMSAIALTDEMNLFALVKFYRQAIKAGIKPIIGAELFIYIDEAYCRLSVLCQNDIGYQHLIQIISRAYLERKPGERLVVNREWLLACREGLIILSGGCEGDIGRLLLQNKFDLAEKRIQNWQQHFGHNFYLEIQRIGRSAEEDYIQAAVRLAAKFNVPLVATNPIRFFEAEDFEAHEARVCIHRGEMLNNPARHRLYTDQQYFKSALQMAELFADIPEAIANTVEIAKRCTVKLSFGKVYLPNFPIPADTTLEQYFSMQAAEGLQNRLNSKAKEKVIDLQSYERRLEKELAIINKMGFAGYFLIVADFINWAKQQDIPVGPGRGSGAGSLVAYALGITEPDPIEHELLFERFLNPERVSLPDFDIDFCMEGRDRVIDYVIQRYGTMAVAQIITYGTMAARAVVRDVGRVLGFSYGLVDKIAKLIPFELGVTLEKALKEEALKNRYQDDEMVRTLIDLALKLEGLTRNAGKHAGGVVIAPTKLTDFVPLYCESSSEHIVTQFDKDDIEAVGLVKFDFLGLRTLTIIHRALKTIQRKRDLQGLAPLDINSLPLDDKKTYDLLKKCTTTAVFQLESRGMKDLIRRLQPDNFNDIMALVALFRPGPLQSGMVDDFIDCKQGHAPVHYPHPDLKSILQPTYGVILYQDQVMQIAQVLAGYSLGSADILRSAMGKKKPQEMAKQRVIFIEGAKNRGIDPKVAEHIFNLMEKFAGYGFNKSHSTAYAMITYQTAWLKAHFPAEFMAAVLSSDMDNTDKMASLVSECRDMQLNVLPPNINISDYYFTVNDEGHIHYGLGAIKGVGEAAIESLIDARNKFGEFKNLFEFCYRIDIRKFSRRALEPLIRSGAMDCFNLPRATLMASLDNALQSAEQKHRNQLIGQNDLFALVEEPEADTVMRYIDCKEWNEQERLRGEKETLGLYVSGHPLQASEKELEGLISSTIAELQVSGKNHVSIAGMIISTRMITTRNGKRIIIITIEDRSARIEVTVFSELYDKIRDSLIDGTIFIIRGTVAEDEYTGGIKMVAESLLPLNQVREQTAKRLQIRFPDQRDSEKLLQELQSTIAPYRGGHLPIYLTYRVDDVNAELSLGDAWRVTPKDDLLNQLQQLCGIDNVSVVY